MIQPFFINRDRCLRIIIFSIITMGCTTNCQIGITNKVIIGGWFGDNTLHYIKSRWLAYKYNLKFYFQPFTNAHLFAAFKDEIRLTDAPNTFIRLVPIKHEAHIASNLIDGTLFSLEEWASGFGFEVENLVTYLLLNSPQDFINLMKPLLKPSESIALPSIPPHLISVGVHIRKPLVSDYPLFGAQEFDTSQYNLIDEIIPITKNKTIQNRLVPKISCISKALYADVHEGPMKFPPTQYYIDQIKRLSEFLNDAPLFVQLFSWYPDQTELYDTIKKAVNKKNIVYAHDIIQWSSGLIADHFAMSNYDCLIKSTSTFSTIAQLAGDHAICIVPNQYFWDNTKLVVNKSSWFIRDEELNNIKNKASLAA